MPEPLATEIRFAAGSKITVGDWTPNSNLRVFLLLLVAAAKQHGHRSILERDEEAWHLLLRQFWARRTSRYDNQCRPYFRTFYSTLLRGLTPDPWSEDRWLWKNCFSNIVPGPHSNAEHGNIRWDLMATVWLRAGSKELARRLLMTGDRKWTTVINWVRDLRLLDRYLVIEALDAPTSLDREAFLDFLGWVREQAGSKHNLMGVTRTAWLLETLRADRIVPELGSAVYLRRGENAVRKPRNPRPYPADVVSRIDGEIIDDPSVDPTVRTMLRFARWAGPRISELVALPLDVLRHHSRGFWVEYWMTKTESWRRFPLPDDLAHDIQRQQEHVRRMFSDSAEYLFPGPRSKAGPGKTHPWTPSGFRSHLRVLFTERGINRSTITGETVTGGEFHRFRHTVGTALLNNNWTQPEVQEFLGHATAAMTTFYARITDDTLRAKADEFHRQQGADSRADEPDAQVERLREKFTVVLPNGACALPAGMKCDFRPNPCLDCSFFQAAGDGVLDVNRAHRGRLKVFVEQAQSVGDQAVVDLNLPTLQRLNQLLADDGSPGEHQDL